MANGYANFGGQMCTTLLTMFSFFFFFWNAKIVKFLYIFGEYIVVESGERRWNLKIDGHETMGTFMICVFLWGGELDGPVIVPTDHLAVYCTLLYTVCYPLLERIYVAFRGDEWINPREFRIINRNLISYIEIVYSYLGCYLSCCFV